MALSKSVKIEDDDDKTNITGGGFGLFFDATYVEIGLGLDFANGIDPDDSDDKGTDFTYFSISLFGKYPIALGEKITLFPLVGFDWNIWTTMKGTFDGAEEVKRADFDDSDDIHVDYYDILLIDLGVGADFALSDKLYLRASAMYGIKFNSKDQQKLVDEADAKIFTGGVTIKAGVGYKF
jgi:hypothetical protein